MRSLRLSCVLISALPSVLACSSQKGPEGDIGYGASDGIGNTGNESAGGTGNTGGKSGGSGKSGSGNGGSGDPQGDAGSGDGPPNPDGCGDFWTAQAPEAECELDNLQDSGMTLGVDKGTYRSIDQNLTLPPNKTYKLDGPTFIEPGVTLTIGKCTKVLGMSAPSALIALSGLKKVGLTDYEAGGPPGRLVAVGEPNAPIIFTSWKKAGERLRGDWGGIVLAGKAPDNYLPYRSVVNDGKGPLIAEGLDVGDARSGWKDDTYADEDSGHLEYVRIEFVGREVSAAAETNGLTLNAVGSGTKLSHIMVSNSIDDCFEWFGGRVNADHLIAFNCDDDAFDADLGYQGKVQFAFTRQFPTTNETDSNGFEWDGQSKDSGQFQLEPFTTPQFSNVTACGGNTDKFLANPRYGMVLRRGAKGSIINALLTGYGSAAFAVRDPAFTATTLTSSTAWSNKLLYDPVETATPAMWFESQDGNSAETPAGMCDCWAAQPQPYALEKIRGKAPGEGYPEPDADFQGAFKDATPESNWMSGLWVDWSEK